MSSAQETSRRVRLLRRALDLGLVLEEEVIPSAGHAEATLDEEQLAAIFDGLVARGRLDPARLAVPGPSDPPVNEDNPSLDRLAYLAPPEPDPSLVRSEFPLPRGDRYLPLAYLGDGGMGRVYKAWDQQLHRVVALKFLKRAEPEAVERFLSEARAQAQLDHPGVCRVYSVGQTAGQAFLAMQFIEGPTLRTALPGLGPREVAAIARDAAEALHACHRQGILHRDIKPTNIMLERAEDGSWRPFLLDFGLALDLDARAGTPSGILVGTPVYASPEQVQGGSGNLDRRSDLHALGATLYEALCGEPPFPYRGSLADLLRRIAEEEPPDLHARVPRLPKDLATIVHKCLEKDPARRYASARALAEDLRRFLDGDPIRAREASWGYRLATRLRKNRALAAAAGLSLLALLGIAGLGAHAALDGRRRTAYAQRLARETERMQSALALAYSLPAHDTRPDRARLEAGLAAIRRDLERQGDWAQAPGRLALGQGLLALDRLEEARVELDEAHRLAPGDPDAALALGVTLARLYGQELEGLRGRAREDRRRELEPTLVRPAVDLLRAARAQGADAAEQAEGMLALVEDRPGEALQKARQALARNPWNWEALVLEAEARKTEAALLLARGDHAAAEAALTSAGEGLARAMDLARSAPRPSESEAQRCFLVLALRFDQRTSTAADRDRALAAIATALKVNPDNTRVLGFRAAVHRRWALVQRGAGQDPGPSFDLAAEACEAGLKAVPGDAVLINNLASVLRNRADWEMERGQDPGPVLHRAIAALESALAKPRHADLLWNNLGNCHGLLGRWQLLHGEDPTGALTRAADCLTRAAAVKPWVGHPSSRGSVLVDLALYHAWQGQDPRADLDAALAAFDEALGLNPNSHQALEGAAEARLLRAAATGDRQDPERALAHLDRLLGLRPDLAGARWRRVEALARRGSAAPLPPPGAPGDPELACVRASALLALDAAGAAPAGALAILRALSARHPSEGRLALAEGRLLARRGQAAEAARSFDRAARANPNLRRAAAARS